MPVFPPEHWNALDAHGMVDQEKPAVVLYCEEGMRFAFTANTDKWLEMWHSINSQIEHYRIEGAGTIFVCLRRDSGISVTPIPPTLTDLRLGDETDELQQS